MGIIIRALLTSTVFALAAAAQIRFEERTIGTGLRGGYQVIAVDLNRDGRTDLVALSSGLKDLLWFENPGSPAADWPRHVIAGNLNRMINVVAQDLDGDGYPEFVVAHEFENEASRSIGIVSVIRSSKPGDLQAPWKVEEIDRLTTSHRLRSARVAKGRTVVVNAPLTGAKAVAPDYADNAPLVFYDPAHGMKREVIGNDNRGVVHGVFITDWDRDGKGDEVMTASFSGIHVHKPGKDGKWTRSEFSKEQTSDIAVGHLGKRRIVAAIEPWHGNRVVVYMDGKRQVIDESLGDGHTILTADFDGDGRDEVVAGCRQGPKSVFLWRNTKQGWIRQTVDDGKIAAAACTAADLNGDGRPDLACIGSATANLKIYLNLAGKPASR